MFTPATAGVDILRGLSLEARSNEITLVIGPNGAGKSTLLRTVFAFLAPNQGQLFFRRSRDRRPAPERPEASASATSRRTSQFSLADGGGQFAMAHGVSAATRNACSAARARL